MTASSRSGTTSPSRPRGRSNEPTRPRLHPPPGRHPIARVRGDRDGDHVHLHDHPRQPVRRRAPPPISATARPPVHLYRAASNTVDGTLIAAPTGVAIWAQSTGAFGTGTTWAAVVGTAACLLIKSFFEDRKHARAEKLALTNARNA